MDKKQADDLDEATYRTTCQFRDEEHVAEAEGFNACWERLAANLPDGEPGERVELLDACGSHDGYLEWHAGRGWTFATK